MKYQIELTKEAESDLEFLYKSDKKFFERIISKIDSLFENPWQGKPLVGNHKGEYSLRIGNYRVIYMADSEKHTIFILTVKHLESAVFLLVKTSLSDL